MKFTQYTLIISGALMCTTLGIDAADTLRGSQSTMLAQLAGFSGPTEVPCEIGMHVVDSATGSFCIDSYEAGVGAKCGIAKPGSVSETASNVVDRDCLPVSEAGVEPWTYVTYHQAAQLCRLAGKRLPSGAEWYQAALGTRDTEACIIEGGIAYTGSSPTCVSSSGAYDMIGNVWEHIDQTVDNGRAGTLTFPDSGYVLTTNADGLPLETSSIASEHYARDYVWHTKAGVSAVLRGGFYGAGSDAGIYSTHAATPLEFGSAAIGFRCVKTLTSRYDSH